MQPYIILKSLRDGVIRKEVFEKYYVKRQRSLSI